MTTAYWLVGDTRRIMAELPPASVDLILTSPPFLALRSYLPADDPAKGDEIGSEATPGAFIDTLLDVTESCARLLAPHGTLCVELGDTYSGSGGGGGDYLPGGFREGQPGFGGSAERQRDGNAAWRQKNANRAAWPLAKSLTLIPETYRYALTYGHNPHTGRPTPPWRIRNVIRWVRPNPPVGALGDKFRPATSEMVVACKSERRWFDLDAVRTAHADPAKEASRTREWLGRKADALGHMNGDGQSNPAGAPPLDWWEIPTHGYPGTHYATWPPALCVTPIEAMCPRRVCRTCGTPSRRLTEQTGDYAEHRERARAIGDGQFNANNAMWVGGKSRPQARGSERVDAEYATTGWSTCSCPGADGLRLDGYHTGTGWRPGIVLDPFGGSGTTAVVATGHGRTCIAIDLDARNVDLARERIGMWLTETTPTELTALLTPNVEGAA